MFRIPTKHNLENLQKAFHCLPSKSWNIPVLSILACVCILPSARTLSPPPLYAFIQQLITLFDHVQWERNDRIELEFCLDRSIDRCMDGSFVQSKHKTQRPEHHGSPIVFQQEYWIFTFAEPFSFTHSLFWRVCNENTKLVHSCVCVYDSRAYCCCRRCVRWCKASKLTKRNVLCIPIAWTLSLFFHAGRGRGSKNKLTFGEFSH